MSFNGNFMPTSFKVGLLNGVFAFTPGTSDGYYIALYDNTGATQFNATTSAYAVANGQVPNGAVYNTGGLPLTVSSGVPAPLSPYTSGTIAYINFDNVTWAAATITARGALIYKNATVTIGGASVVKPVIAVLDFGSDKSSSASNFTIQFPSVGDGSTAILRIA